jgi:hypothetical protein
VRRGEINRECAVQGGRRRFETNPSHDLQINRQYTVLPDGFIGANVRLLWRVQWTSLKLGNKNKFTCHCRRLQKLGDVSVSTLRSQWSSLAFSQFRTACTCTRLTTRNFLACRPQPPLSLIRSSQSAPSPKRSPVGTRPEFFKY